MSALLQQILASALTLAFGVLCLLVWRSRAAPAPDRPMLAWGISAAYFMVVGVYSTLHAFANFGLMSAGSGSRIYAPGVSVSLAANVGRAATAVAFPVLLAVAASQRGRAPASRVREAGTGLALLALAATVAAHRLQDGSNHQHLSVLAVLGAAVAILLMGTLLLSLVNDGIDRLLWFALAAYALKEVLNVSLLAIMAWWTTAPDPAAWRIFYWLAMAAMASMCALAARRLRLARAGTRVPALLERGPPVRHPVIG